MMKRNMMLKILNPFLGVLLVNQIVTAIFHGVLPRETFEAMHQGGGILLALAAVLHVLLNWNWVRANFLRKKANSGTQTAH